MCLLWLPIIALVLWLRWPGGRRATVVVLGDVGRSPRMCYHAVSLAKAEFAVTLVGYAGTRPSEEVLRRCTLRHIKPFQSPVPVPYIVYAFCKVLFDVMQLAWLLVACRKAALVLLQTPPCIPAMLVCKLASTLRGTSLCFDFHNIGYTMLALKLGQRHRLVWLAAVYERVLARTADSALCVTSAMRSVLLRWGVNPVHVLYDRPAPHFAPTSAEAQHELFERLHAEGALEPLRGWASASQPFTTKQGSAAADRPQIIVSSTSWTPEEDFGMLLKALPELDALLQHRAVIFITGRGPDRAAFEARAAELELKNVRVCCLWLKFEDYPLLLGSADVGLSLHKSSSGLDLPMKVVDMLGSGLPVCALGFVALPELVTEKQGGSVFWNATELVASLVQMLNMSKERRTELVEGAMAFRAYGWENQWSEIAFPAMGCACMPPAHRH